jgi:hypothetical protein
VARGIENGVLHPHGVEFVVARDSIARRERLRERVGRIMSDEFRRGLIAPRLLGRLGVAEDSALATLFLASAPASWRTASGLKSRADG